MNLSQIGTFISLVFPPAFVILTHYCAFEAVTFFFGVFIFLYLILSFILKYTIKSISTPLLYFTFIVVAYFTSSMEFIKLIPALISFTFFFLFLNAYIQKKEFILSITKKFYSKKLDENKEKFLAQSDGYWALVLFGNSLVQIVLVFYDNNEIWAFYSSVGWYFYMFIALVFQIMYGKLYVVRSEKNKGNSCSH